MSDVSCLLYSSLSCLVSAWLRRPLCRGEPPSIAPSSLWYMGALPTPAGSLSSLVQFLEPLRGLLVHRDGLASPNRAPAIITGIETVPGFPLSTLILTNDLMCDHQIKSCVNL